MKKLSYSGPRNFAQMRTKANGSVQKNIRILDRNFYFSIAAGIYLNARLVSPRIPETGEIDLQ
jgi:hypothetical protein